MEPVIAPEQYDGETVDPLTLTQIDTLVAVIDRLVPVDQHGAGGVEAGIVTYIERTIAATGEMLAIGYRDGLNAADVLSRQQYGRAFVRLRAEEQDAVLALLQPSSFFETIHAHAIEGMFGDPSYGGNRGLVGWKLIGFPGVRPFIPPEEQALDVEVQSRGGSRGGLQFRDRDRFPGQ